MKTLKEIAEDLHELNFNQDNGIICTSTVLNGTKSARQYSYSDIKDNIRDEKPAHHYEGGCRFCHDCDKYADKLLSDGTNKLPDNSECEYRFTNITHGTHTLDFLEAHGKTENDVENWSHKPVLFVMENPGAYDACGYEKKAYDGSERYLCKWWYWINGQGLDKNRDCKFEYPAWFVQKEYGWLIYSIINTFKIANACVTNMVKCGIGCDGDGYKTTDYYNTEIVDTCIYKYLLNELKCLRGGEDTAVVTVFAFGLNTYTTLVEKLKDDKNCRIYLLPHPANHLANDYRKYVLLGKIMRGLLQTDFYESDSNKDIKNSSLEELFKNDCEDKDEDIIDMEKLINEYGKDKGIEFEKDAQYALGKYGYAIKYKSSKSKHIKAIEMWYTPNKSELADYRMSRCDYNFATGEIRLFKNRKRATQHCEDLVCENHHQYKIFNIMKDFLKNKLQIESPTIASNPK